MGDAYPRGGEKVTATDSMEVYGGGRDVYEGRDEFHFVSRSGSGSFQASAMVTPPDYTDRYAKAGLMFRSTTEAESPLAMVSVTPDGECKFAYRRDAGGRIDEEVLAAPGEAKTISLKRNGAEFEAAALDATGRTIASRSESLPEFPQVGRLGLFVCSHNVFALSTAGFAGIKIQAK